MSNIVLNRTFKHSQQKNAYRLALIALADRADKKGLCDPGFADIAERCNISERQAKRLVAGLEETGELYIGHGGGRHSTNLYFVTCGLSCEQIETTLSEWFNLGDKVTETAQAIYEKIESGGLYTGEYEPNGVTRAQKGVPDDTVSHSEKSDIQGVDEDGKGVTDDTVYTNPDQKGDIQGQETVSSIPPEPPLNLNDSNQNPINPIEGEPQKSESPPNGADAPPPPIPVSSFPAGEVPDPADYTIKQIEGWKLYKAQWLAVLEREKTGKDRAGVKRHIAQRLEKKPVAVEVYREEAQTYPEKATWSLIDEAVGEDPEDLNFWRRVVKYGIGVGWKKYNIVAMLDHYNRREIPGQKHGGYQNGQNGANPSQRPPKIPATIQRAEWPIEATSNAAEDLGFDEHGNKIGNW